MSHLHRPLKVSLLSEWVGLDKYGPLANDDTEMIGTKEYKQVWIESKSLPWAEEVRRNYFESKDEILPEFASKGLLHFTKSSDPSEKVAWHIRRGDVDATSKHRRYMSNDDISIGLLALHKKHSLKVVHFFSEGQAEDFESIIEVCRRNAITCKLHLNEDLRSSHYLMSTADILVTAKSTFSTTAAFLNQGVVYSSKDLAKNDVKLSTSEDIFSEFQALDEISFLESQDM